VNRSARSGALVAAGFLLMSLAESIGAQDSVTATSGDPRVIAAIRSRFATVQRKLARYAVVDRELAGFSAEGGTVRGYFDGPRLMKLEARHFGETGRATEEYFFDGAEPVFVYHVSERYDRPLSGRVVRRVETRYYLDHGRLVRRVHAATGSTDVGERVEWMSTDEIRRDAKRLMSCVRATTPEPEECDADAQPSSGP